MDVYGKLLERPSEIAVKAARDALPKDDQVGSEGSRWISTRNMGLDLKMLG